MTPYITTASGIDFEFLNPRPEQIVIEDIAHGLSHKCRFGGHLRSFYSVAQHSLAVANFCELEFSGRAVTLHALLHDAAEAYLADIPAPIKAHLPDCRAMGQRIQTAIDARFGLCPDLFARVQRADQVMLATEARYFGVPGWQRWAEAEPLDLWPRELDGWLQPFAPDVIRRAFLDRFQTLTPDAEQMLAAHWSAIKPGPFCGQTGELDRFSIDPECPDYQVLCRDLPIDCRGAQPLEQGWATPEAAIAAWNQREPHENPLD